jgi:hypothetical protein
MNRSIAEEQFYIRLRIGSIPGMYLVKIDDSVSDDMAIDKHPPA